MSTEDSSAEERIILATIACIERTGIEKLTVRAIAEEARVNGAAINYYFRSKDNLVARVMQTTLDHLFEDLESIAKDETLEPTARVSEMVDYLIDGATRYPGVTRAHFSRAMNAPSVEDPFTARMNAILAKLRSQIAGAAGGGTGKTGDAGLDLLLIALFSSAILPAVLPSFFREFSGVDFRDSRMRKRYVRTITENAGLEPGP